MGRQGLAIASLVLGILSLCSFFFWFCSGPLGVVGIILGFLAVRSPSRPMAMAGIILSIVGLILTIVITIVLQANSSSIMHELQVLQSTIQPGTP